MPYSVSGTRKITLLSAATTSAAPTVTDASLGVVHLYTCDQAIVLVRSTAGSGTMTAALRLWGFEPESARWYDLGPLNGGTPIPETSIADTISYSEGVAGLRGFTKFYCEITSLGGTGTAVTVEMILIPATPVTHS